MSMPNSKYFEVTGFSKEAGAYQNAYSGLKRTVDSNFGEVLKHIVPADRAAAKSVKRKLMGELKGGEAKELITGLGMHKMKEFPELAQAVGSKVNENMKAFSSMPKSRRKLTDILEYS